MTMAVNKRQPQQKRRDNGGRCESATDLVADKNRRRTSKAAQAGKSDGRVDKRQWFGGGGRRRAAQAGGRWLQWSLWSWNFPASFFTFRATKRGDSGERKTWSKSTTT
jgi:hypothetical protein